MYSFLAEPGMQNPTMQGVTYVSLDSSFKGKAVLVSDQYLYSCVKRTVLERSI